jgi:spermidine synthase
LTYTLLFSVFVIATCGLVYELIAGTAASYLLGDSVTQFSTIIGVYLFAMGVGSYISKYFHRNLLSVFIQVELLVGLVGGCSAALLFICFEYVESFRVLLYGLVGLTGTLVGLEIPLLMRILQERFEFRELVSKVFTFDYVGALLASLIFPLFLVPHLGLIRSSFLFGILNVLVALWTLYLFKDSLPWAKLHRNSAIVLLIALMFGFAYSDTIMSFAEASGYPDRVIFAKSSPYQRIVLTKESNDLRLFLNGNLQFSSRDEYRYHEALVHVGLAAVHDPKRVLVLGGGDGLAVREILKYPSIQSITLVDLDPEVTRLFSTQALLKKLNLNSLNSPKIKLVNADAFIWLRQHANQFDFIVVDFPDPGNYSVGKLYTDTFYLELKQHLSPEGMIVVQSTSPFYARDSFQCVVNTLNFIGLMTTPYHAYVPSFGDWGYILAGKKPFTPAEHYPKDLRFITPQVVETMLDFPMDMRSSVTSVNKLNNQILVHYFEKEWSEYGQAH